MGLEGPGLKVQVEGTEEQVEKTQEQVGQVSEVVLEVASEEASEEEPGLEQFIATII